MRFEPAEPSAISGSPSLSTTVGAIMLGIRRPGSWRWKPCGFRSSSPSMLFRCTPVPGTMTPEQEPFEQVTVAQPPRSSSTHRWVVEPSRDDTSVGCRLERLAGHELLQVALGVQTLQELLGARPVGLVHHLDERAQVPGPADALEQVERVSDQDPAGRRRRVREDLAAAVARAGRLARDRRVRVQVGARQQAAALEHVVAHRRGHVAGVEEVRTLGAEPLEQVGELRQPDRVAGAEQPAARRVDRPALGLRGEDRAEDLGQERLHLGERRALARRPRRARPRDRPCAACRSARAPRRSRSGCRRRRTRTGRC